MQERLHEKSQVSLSERRRGSARCSEVGTVHREISLFPRGERRKLRTCIVTTRLGATSDSNDVWFRRWGDRYALRTISARDFSCAQKRRS